MDRYSVLAIIVIIVMISFSSFGIDDDFTEIEGLAVDVNDSDSGFVFYIQDGSGNMIRSFSHERPDDSIHSFQGDYSKDGDMFFVSKII